MKRRLTAKICPQLNIPADREPTEQEEAEANRVIADAKIKIREAAERGEYIRHIHSEPESVGGLRVYSWSSLNRVPVYKQQ